MYQLPHSNHARLEERSTACASSLKFCKITAVLAQPSLEDRPIRISFCRECFITAISAVCPVDIQRIARLGSHESGDLAIRSMSIKVCVAKQRATHVLRSSFSLRQINHDERLVVKYAPIAA